MGNWRNWLMGIVILLIGIVAFFIAYKAYDPEGASQAATAVEKMTDSGEGGVSLLDTEDTGDTGDTGSGASLTRLEMGKAWADKARLVFLHSDEDKDNGSADAIEDTGDSMEDPSIDYPDGPSDDDSPPDKDDGSTDADDDVDEDCDCPDDDPVGQPVVAHWKAEGAQRFAAYICVDNGVATPTVGDKCSGYFNFFYLTGDLGWRGENLVYTKGPNQGNLVRISVADKAKGQTKVQINPHLSLKCRDNKRDGNRCLIGTDDS